MKMCFVQNAFLSSIRASRTFSKSAARRSSSLLFMACCPGPLTDEYMTVVGFDEEEMVDGELTSEQEKELEEGKFSGELCGGAVKARCVVPTTCTLLRQISAAGR